MDGTIRSRQSRGHIAAEWRELSEAGNRLVLALDSVVSSLEPQPIMARFYQLGATLPPSAQTYYSASAWHGQDHARAYAAGMVARAFGISLEECIA